MTELKIRFWSKTKKRFIVPTSVRLKPERIVKEPTLGLYSYVEDGVNCRLVFNRVGKGGSHVEDKNLIKEEFTGLQDVNGRDIYEGDIVKDRNPFISSHSSYFYEVYKKEEKNILRHMISEFVINGDEIVGNIHENPELIK